MTHKSKPEVDSQLEGDSSNQVLVFLKPVSGVSKFQDFAWREFNPAKNDRGATEFVIDLGQDIAISGNNSPSGSELPKFSTSVGEKKSETGSNN